MEKIQEGAIDFVVDFSKSELSNIISFTPLISILNFNKLGNSPSGGDLEYFKKITIYENEKHYPLIANSREHYMFHPKSFIKDYGDSYWRPGFLNLVLCSNFDYTYWLDNYKKLIDFIRRVRF